MQRHAWIVRSIPKITKVLWEFSFLFDFLRRNVADSGVQQSSIVIPVDDSAMSLSGTDCEPGVVQNWTQFFVSENSDDPSRLKISGEPGRTRTCNPLLNPEMLSSWFFKNFLAS
jgi:hypothetical protein